MEESEESCYSKVTELKKQGLSNEKIQEKLKGNFKYTTIYGNIKKYEKENKKESEPVATSKKEILTVEDKLGPKEPRYDIQKIEAIIDKKVGHVVEEKLVPITTKIEKLIEKITPEEDKVTSVEMFTSVARKLIEKAGTTPQEITKYVNGLLSEKSMELYNKLRKTLSDTNVKRMPVEIFEGKDGKIDWVPQKKLSPVFIGAICFFGGMLAYYFISLLL